MNIEQLRRAAEGPQNIRNPIMVLLRKSDIQKLQKVPYNNMVPLVKLFGGSCFTWLLTHMAPDGTLYGYGDIGQGCVEYGTLFSVNEIAAMRFPPFNTYLERDRWFTHKEGTNYLKLTSLVGI